MTPPFDAEAEARNYIGQLAMIVPMTKATMDTTIDVLRAYLQRAHDRAHTAGRDAGLEAAAKVEDKCAQDHHEAACYLARFDYCASDEIVDQALSDRDQADVRAIVLSRNCIAALLDVLDAEVDEGECHRCGWALYDGDTDRHEDTGCLVGIALATLRTELDRVAPEVGR